MNNNSHIKRIFEKYTRIKKLINDLQNKYVNYFYNSNWITYTNK